jgi:protein-disulfide isomerase
MTGTRPFVFTLMVALFASAVAYFCLTPSAMAEPSDTEILSREKVLRDPDIPATGNLKGDITIVEYFDYQCPYCKKVHADLLKAVLEDGNVRLVFKNWPIFGGISVYSARLALATKYQNRYAEAHTALITAPIKLEESRVRDLLAKAGIDIGRAEQDLQLHAETIDAALARTNAQAEAFDFQGTPGFIIGTFRVPGVLDVAGFKQAIADARLASKSKR